MKMQTSTYNWFLDFVISTLQKVVNLVEGGNVDYNSADAHLLQLGMLKRYKTTSIVLSNFLLLPSTSKLQALP